MVQFISVQIVVVAATERKKWTIKEKEQNKKIIFTCYWHGCVQLNQWTNRQQQQQLQRRQSIQKKELLKTFSRNWTEFIQWSEARKAPSANIHTGSATKITRYLFLRSMDSCYSFFSLLLRSCSSSHHHCANKTPFPLPN